METKGVCWHRSQGQERMVGWFRPRWRLWFERRGAGLLLAGEIGASKNKGYCELMYQAQVEILMPRSS